MGTFAAVVMPLDLTRRGAADVIALDIVETFPGTRNVSLDAAAATVSFELHFPGNLTALRRRLQNAKIGVGERAEVSLPVETIVPERMAAAAHAGERIVEGTEVWDVEFPIGKYIYEARVGDGRVEATIAPSSLSMHQMYDALLSLGLIASDGTPPDVFRP